MSELDRVARFLKNHPHSHQTFFSRPYVNRRRFFEILGAGVTGSYLLPRLKAEDAVTTSGVTTQNKARNVIFILLTGAISHTDTFDLKVVNGVTPSDFQPPWSTASTGPWACFPR